MRTSEVNIWDWSMIDTSTFANLQRAAFHGPREIVGEPARLQTAGMVLANHKRPSTDLGHVQLAQDRAVIPVVRERSRLGPFAGVRQRKPLKISGIQRAWLGSNQRPAA